LPGHFLVGKFAEQSVLSGTVSTNRLRSDLKGFTRLSTHFYFRKSNNVLQKFATTQFEEKEQAV
jgi:hypothetical protein